LVARDQSRPGELRDSLLVDLLCVDDMICIRDRVTRDIQPGTSADRGWRLSLDPPAGLARSR
jgi:hypothetical protein